MIRLIPDRETEVLSFGASAKATTFEVLHLNAGHVEDCVRRATVNGRYDAAAYNRLLWALILCGWTNLLDVHGKAIEYRDDADLKAQVVRGLPAAVKNRLHAAALGDADEETAALGNSAPSSVSG